MYEYVDLDYTFEIKFSGIISYCFPILSSPLPSLCKGPAFLPPLELTSLSSVYSGQ